MRHSLRNQLIATLSLALVLNACRANVITPDQATNGGCTDNGNGTMDCKTMRFGEESLDSDSSDIDVITPSPETEASGNETVADPVEDESTSDEDDTDSNSGNGSGNASTGGGGNGGGGGGNILGAFGNALDGLYKGILGGLDSLFGNSKKKKKEKEREIQRKVAEAANVAQQVAELGQSAEENYREDTQAIRTIGNGSNYDPKELDDQIRAKARDHDEGIDSLGGETPELNPQDPPLPSSRDNSDKSCHQLRDCDRSTPEQKKVHNTKDYIEGAREHVKENFTGNERKAREGILNTAESTADAAEKSYAKGDSELGDQLVDLSLKLTDFAISSIPIAGDIYTIANAIAGENFITGEPISKEQAVIDITISVLSLASGGIVGVAGDLNKGKKILEVAAEEALEKKVKEELGEEAAEAAIKRQVKEQSERRAKDIEEGLKDAEKELETKKNLEKGLAEGKERNPLPDNEAFHYDNKIKGQIDRRGWTEESVNDTLRNPDRTVKTRDTRNNPSTGTRNDDPATAYFDKDGNYVVRNDTNGNIVQVSDKNDPNWITNLPPPKE